MNILVFGATVFRPGVIQPVHGARSKTASYRFFYALAKPLFPVLRLLFRNSILTTQMIGQAMLAVARSGARKALLAPQDIGALSAAAAH